MRRTIQHRWNHFYFFLLFFAASGCQEELRKPRFQAQIEWIDDKEMEEIAIPSPVSRAPPLYPWSVSLKHSFPVITKEHFRCKGCPLHPRKVDMTQGQAIYFHDCGGLDDHSLPIREGKEFIYPVLLEILNYLQETSGRRVVIWTGHRCFAHQRYVDVLMPIHVAKHQLGAAVSFTVEGWEFEKERIFALIRQYYIAHPRFQQDKAFTEFALYRGKDTDVRTTPWYNQEVFVKWYQADEGRDEDNTHQFPYIQIQVRWDRDRGEKVVYGWKEAQRNVFRW